MIKAAMLIVMWIFEKDTLVVFAFLVTKTFGVKVNFSGAMEKLNSDSGCCSTIAIRVFVSVSGHRHGTTRYALREGLIKKKRKKREFSLS